MKTIIKQGQEEQMKRGLSGNDTGAKEKSSFLLSFLPLCLLGFVG